MGAFSNDMETKLLDYTLKTAASTNWVQPASVWVGLCTADPSDAASSECAAGTYKRMQVAFAVANGSSIAGSTATVTFPQATGTSWSTIHGYALFDSSSAGNMLYYANLASDVTVNVNDTVEFAASAIVVSLD